MSRSVLIVGSGGREFALAQQFSEDPTVEQIIVVPGNPAMGTISKCSVCIGNVVELAIRNAVDLAVIGPEQPLVNGLADDLRSVDIPVLGPSKAAAVLEQSKISSKQFMQTMGIPTARAVWYDSPEDAMSGLDEWSTTDGVVVKTDALAGGKGVVLCDSAEDAKSVVHDFMVNPTISVQTEQIVFEENSMALRYPLLRCVMVELGVGWVSPVITSPLVKVNKVPILAGWVLLYQVTF